MTNSPCFREAIAVSNVIVKIDFSDIIKLTKNITKKLVITNFLVIDWLYFLMYFPRMSVSMLSLSPTFFDLKLVTVIVCGIIQTDARSFFASTTVRLIPSSATEPFFTTYLASFFGTLNQNFTSIGFFSIFVIVATPSMCPKTKWPSNLSPTFKLRSTLTVLPAFTFPKSVFYIVSSIISKIHLFLEIFVALRQTPFIATL